MNRRCFFGRLAAAAAAPLVAELAKDGKWHVGPLGTPAEAAVPEVLPVVPTVVPEHAAKQELTVTAADGYQWIYLSTSMQTTNVSTSALISYHFMSTSASTSLW